MTAWEYHNWVLSCDSPVGHEDNRSMYYHPARRILPMAESRAEAAEDGWVHIASPDGPDYGLDFCPLHAPAAEGSDG